jgi:ribonuclease inhibitor
MMKKVLLDLSVPDSKRGVHEYIAEQMEFPDYYGHNLDALYDMLTSVTEPTAVGLFPPAPDFDELDFDLMVYIDRVCDVFRDAESVNPELAVIFGYITDNSEYPEEDPEELSDLDELDFYSE